MEKILLKFIEQIEQAYGNGGLWLISIFLGVFLLFLVTERFHKARIASARHDNKKFDIFLKVFEGKIEEKQPLIIEQGFSHYFGYALNGAEIQYALNSTKPTQLLNDIKRARSIINYQESEEEYKVEPDYISIEFRKNIAVILYWGFAILGLASMIWMLHTKDIGWLLTVIMGFSVAAYALKFVVSSYAASRILNDYKQRPKDSLIILPR